MSNAILAVAFVAIAMVSGGIVSIYRMDKSIVEAKNAASAENVDTVLAELISVVQIDEETFSCGVSRCTQTEFHQHGLCVQMYII